MKPLGKHLHVRLVPLDERTASGLYIPEQARAVSKFGGPKLWDVLAVGLSTEIYPGDRVLTFSYTSGALELDNGTAIISDDVVLAIIPRDNRYET